MNCPTRKPTFPAADCPADLFSTNYRSRIAYPTRRDGLSRRTVHQPGSSPVIRHRRPGQTTVLGCSGHAAILARCRACPTDHQKIAARPNPDLIDAPHQADLENAGYFPAGPEHFYHLAGLDRFAVVLHFFAGYLVAAVADSASSYVCSYVNTNNRRASGLSRLVRPDLFPRKRYAHACYRMRVRNAFCRTLRRFSIVTGTFGSDGYRSKH